MLHPATTRPARRLPPVNAYYDWTEPRQYSADDEGNLVMLCDGCARGPLAAGAVALAERGHADSACEQCGRRQP